MFDPATGSPLVWYEGTGTSDRRFLHEDERGSVIATSNSSGTMLSIDSYDEFGIPASTNTGRFGYTGQAWLPELGMWYYRARMYSATLGRFMQTDPIGFGGGMNLYAYVGNDPINLTDPSGLCNEDGTPSYPGEDCDPIPVNGKRPRQNDNRDLFDRMKGHSGGDGTLTHSDGGTSQTPACPPQGISVTRNGNDAEISGNVLVKNSTNNSVPWGPISPIPSGVPVPDDLANGVINSINSSFSGRFGSINLSTHITRGSGGPTIFLSPGAGSGGTVLGGSWMMIGSPPPGVASNSPYMSSFDMTSAHEFGHLLGIPHSMSGLMSESMNGTRPSDEDVESLINRCALKK